MNQNRPSWQVADCPSWCVREHEESDRNGYRDHQIEGIYVLVIRLIRHIPVDEPSWLELVADDVLVAATRARQIPTPRSGSGCRSTAVSAWCFVARALLVSVSTRSLRL